MKKPKDPPPVKISVRARAMWMAQQLSAKNDVRYFMNGVRIEPHPDIGVMAIGTDGHRLVAIHDPEGFASEVAVINAPRTMFNSASRPERDQKEVLTCEYERGEPTAVGMIRSAEGASMSAALVKIVDAGGLDWRRLIPKEVGPMQEATHVNGKYLAECAKLIFGGNRLANGVRISQSINKDGPIYLWAIPSSDEMKSFCVVMPMRGDKDEVFDLSWVGTHKPNQDELEKTNTTKKRKSKLARAS